MGSFGTFSYLRKPLSCFGSGSLFGLDDVGKGAFVFVDIFLGDGADFEEETAVVRAPV